jgi:tetratricopeptide (TPR) repeat protein
LGVPGRPASTAPPTTNLEAYEVFLRANAETERAGAGDRDFARALSLYEGAVSMDPDFAEAWARLGRVAAQVYWFEGRPEHLERAREAVQRALALNPDLPDAHLAQGYVHYYGERAYDQALREFLLAQQGQPGNADIVMAIGLIQRRQGNLEAAAQTLVEAAELDPRSSLKAQTTGETLSWMRRFEAALPYYDRAMELEPSSIRPYSRKAGTYFAMGQQDRTRETLRDGFRKAGVSPVQFLSQAATDEDAWLGFVDQWHGMEEIDRALERLSIDPRTRPTTYYLVKAQWRRYQANLAAARVYFDSARVATEQVLARDPGDAKAHSRLAFALAGLERKEEALREANHAVELLPVSKDLFDGSRLVRIRAEVSIMLGDYEVALDDLEYLLSIPSETTVGSLGIEESMRPLRDHPRMRRLLAAR